MVEEKWLDLVDLIDEKFGILKKEREKFTFTDDLGHEFAGHTDRVYFKSPLGEIKLERTSKPLVVDRKVHYNRTAGTGGQIEYVVSDTETTSKVVAYKKNNADEWEAVDLPVSKLSF